MVKCCAVASCISCTHDKSNLVYFRFPKEVELCKRREEPIINSRISPLYFRRPESRLSDKIYIVQGAFPSLHHPNQTATKEDLYKDRLTKRTIQAKRSGDKNVEIPKEK